MYEGPAVGWTMLWSSYANRTVCRMPSGGEDITAIGTAHSSDGLHFTKCLANPILTPTVGSDYDSVYVGSPCIVSSADNSDAGEGAGETLLYYGGRSVPLHFRLSHSFIHTNLKSPCAEQGGPSPQVLLAGTRDAHELSCIVTSLVAAVLRGSQPNQSLLFYRD